MNTPESIMEFKIETIGGGGDFDLNVEEITFD